MSKDSVVKYTLRLNMNNKQHLEINQILLNINPDVYKSKNQFIVDAIEFYLENMGKENVVKKDSEDSSYVSHKEFEQLRTEMIEAAATSARNEVIKILGSVISGMQPVAFHEQTQKDQPTNSIENTQNDEVVNDLVTGWM